MPSDNPKPGWFTLLNMNCAQASQLLGEDGDRRLLRRERLFLRMHLLGCRWCRRYGRQMQLLRTLIAEHTAESFDTHEVRLSEAARRRIAERIGEA